MKKKIVGAQSATEDVAAGSSDRDAASHAAPKHTPGPWHVTKRTGRALAMYGHNVSASHYSRPGITSGLDCVCDCAGQHGEANAHLIAAAPEMYALLRYILEHSGDPIIEDLARAAIAKAEGRH